MCSDKSHIQKNGDLTASIALSKSKQISKSARLITHLQDMSSITGTFEEFCLKEHLFCRTHFSGCFLRLYSS